MARPALKPLVAAAAGIATIGFVMHGDAANAAMLTYDFTVDVTRGNTIGKYTGSVSLDTSNPLVPCSSTSSLLCAFANQHKVEVKFNFLGTLYTEASDRDAASLFFPAVYFTQNQTLVGLSLVVTQPNLQDSFALLGTEFYQGFATSANPYPDPVSKVGLVGSIQYKLRLPDPGPGPSPDPCKTDPGSCNPAAVPEPSEIAGSAFALGLLVWWRSRRQKSVARR